MEAGSAHKTAIKDERFGRKKPSVQLAGRDAPISVLCGSSVEIAPSGATCDSQVSTIRWHIRAELSLPD
jgi:hypothetical protein